MFAQTTGQGPYIVHINNGLHKILQYLILSLYFHFHKISLAFLDAPIMSLYQELCSVMKRFSPHSVNNETAFWINDIICMAFVPDYFIYSQNLCLKQKNLGSCWHLKRCDVELCRPFALLCTIWSFTLFLLCLWETCQIQSNKIHFYFYYPFILLFILQWNNYSYSFSPVF